MLPPTCPSDYEIWLNTPEISQFFSHCMACFVFPLHLFGFYCVLKKTPSNMHSVKWTLFNFHLWNVVMDLMVKVFTIPYPLFPSASGFLLGVFSMMGMNQGVQCWILVTSVCFVCISTTMIFENRFRILNAKNVLWKRLQPFWVLFNIIFCFLVQVPTIIQFPDQHLARETVFKTMPCLPQFLVNTEPIVPSLDSTIIIVTSLVLIFFVFGQLLIFALIIVKQLSSNFGVNMLSENTRRLQKNLMKSLIWQIGIPVLYLVLPTSGAMLTMWSGVFSRVINSSILICVSFHGLVSTLSMILIHQPYRSTVAFWKAPKKSKTSKIANVYPVISPNTVVEVYSIN